MTHITASHFIAPDPIPLDERQLVAGPFLPCNASDGKLLRRFLKLKDAAAFEELVYRHGPMVMGVCRRVLGNTHDADDAYQATFLVLVRKGRSIVPARCVGNWLHGVAYWTATRARSSAARRAEKERLMKMHRSETNNGLDHESLSDLQALLDRELQRLPDRYRAPIVLCELEGKSRREAASQLKVAEGTLSSRLARGRELLRRRLSRKGATALTAGAIAMLLSQSSTFASPGPLLVQSTVKAAGLLAAGKGLTVVTTAKVAALTKCSLKAMLISKLQLTAATIVAAVAIGTGATVVTQQVTANPPIAAPQAGLSASPGFTSAVLPVFAAAQSGEKKDSKSLDQERLNVPPIASDTSVKYDYDIVYVRAARGKQKTEWSNTEPPDLNPPGAELMLLHPNGSQDVLVPVSGGESIADPYVSFDGQSVYFTLFHDTRKEKGNESAGADICRVSVATKQVTQLTHQEKTINENAVDPKWGKPPAHVFNINPCPLPGGRVAFVSDRNGYRGVKDLDTALQLFTMDDDGRNVEQIGHLNLGGAMHPTILTNGRIMFSSSESQGIRIGEQWGLWSIRPDGTWWDPMFSPFVGGSSSLHFHTQLSKGDIVVETYYPGATTQGFGTFLRFSPDNEEGHPNFGPANHEDPRNMSRARADDVMMRYVKFHFAPSNLKIVTEFATPNDISPNCSDGDIGKVTHPGAAPDNHLLLVWSPPEKMKQHGNSQEFDSGIYLVKDGGPVDYPNKMLLVKNDPQYWEMWPRALVPYKRIYGIDEPVKLAPIANDGRKSAQLPAGTPFGLVGSSSLYKRESFPNGVVPQGSVTAGPRNGTDPAKILAEIGAIYRHSDDTPNWTIQGSDAGYYSNSDIWGIRILALEPVTHVGNRPQQFGHASGGNGVGPPAGERLRILGEFPVRKFDGEGKQPVDPDGNPDTSFMAKIPADIAWTFQTIDRHGLVLNMAQTWHQVRPGEVRNNCGGCHAHSQQPTDFNQTLAAKKEYQPFDLTRKSPLFTTREHDQSGKKWDADGKTGVRYASANILNVEYNRDIKPIFMRSCGACHTKDNSDVANGLVLNDETPTRFEGFDAPLPATYVKLAEDNDAKYGPKPIGKEWAYRQQMSRYIRQMQSRRSMLIWKVFGERLDGFKNDDLPTERVAGDANTLEWHGKPIPATKENLRIADLDYTGSIMPPPEAVAGTYKDKAGKTIKVDPLSDEDRLTIARWIDIGCPIDLDYAPKQPQRRGHGWMADDQRPTLALSSPQAGRNESIKQILIGMHDYDSGMDEKSLSVIADFAIDDVEAGKNVADKFTRSDEGVWTWKLSKPVIALPKGVLTVSVKDKEGNVSKLTRTFSVLPTTASGQ